MVVRIPTVPVKVMLTCRECGARFERTLQRQVEEVGEPPSTFTCAACAADKSMVDGMPADVIQKTQLARTALHQRRPERAAATTEDGRARWREKNKDRHKLYRVLQRAGFDFGGEKPFTLADWYKRVEMEFHWACAECGIALTPDTVICSWLVPMSDGGTISLQNAVPLCRRCCNSRAADRRWQNEER